MEAAATEYPVHLAHREGAVRALFAACLLAVAQLAAAAPPARGGVHLLMASLDGRLLDYRISDSRADLLPAWQPLDAAPPPLGVREAVLRAHAWMLRRAPFLDGFAPRSVTLMRASAYGRRDVWYYLVTSDGVASGQRIPALGAQALVLLDGTIVEPDDD